MRPGPGGAGATGKEPARGRGLWSWVGRASGPVKAGRAWALAKPVDRDGPGNADRSGPGRCGPGHVRRGRWPTGCGPFQATRYCNGWGLSVKIGVAQTGAGERPSASRAGQVERAGGAGPGREVGGGGERERERERERTRERETLAPAPAPVGGPTRPPEICRFRRSWERCNIINLCKKLCATYNAIFVI